MPYDIGPRLAQLYDRITKPVLLVVCTLLISGFVVDEVYSIKHPNMGKGITDYKEWQESSVMWQHDMEVKCMPNNKKMSV